MTSVTKSFPARQCTTQQTNYIRKVVNFNDANIASPVDPFGAIPKNAHIARVAVEIVTAFNAAGTNVLTFGTTTASANEIVTAGDVDETAVGVTDVTRARGTALTAAADINLYAKYTQTSTAATAGKAIFIAEFIPDNDG